MVKYAEDKARQQLPVVMSRNFIFAICICFVLFRLVCWLLSFQFIGFRLFWFCLVR